MPFVHTEGGNMAEALRFSTRCRKEVVDVTARVNTVIKQARVQEGLCSLFLTHTTAALTTGEVGEGTEDDLLEVVEKVIPRINFQHAHNPSHAWSHMASSILGPSLSPSIHKFDDELIPSGLSAEGASGVEFTDLNTLP